MRLHHAFLVLIFMFAWSVHAYELITIQAVSDSKRTFITRNGKRQGVIPGFTATFTAENVAIMARARSVTGQFTQWEVVNEDLRIPFEKGAIVTFHRATEYIWALSPEKERRKYIKTQVAKPRNSWMAKGALTRGISESVSGVQVSPTSRAGYLGELYYERGITYNFSFDVGVRYEQEVINYTGVSYNTQRSLLLTDLNYYFDAFRDLLSGGRISIGAGLGYGFSSTQTSSHVQSGPVAVIPAVKIGVNLPFNQTWEFVFDGAFESLQTSEEQASGQEQTTTQTNFKAGFGLRRYL